MTRTIKTVLATSEKPLDLCSGIKTLGISVAEVGYDKEFTLANWEIKILGSATFKITGRFVTGVCGPSYAAYVAPRITYDDKDPELRTYYNYYQKVGSTWLGPNKSTSKPKTSGDPYPFFATDASHPYWVSKEHQVSRSLMVDDGDWKDLELQGGFNVGAWFILSVSLKGSIFWSSVDWSAPTTTINVYEAIMAVIKIVGEGNSFLNPDKDSSTFKAIQNACLLAKAPTSSSLANSVFRGSVLELQVGATAGLDKAAGVELTPSISIGVNILTLWSDRYNTLLRTNPASAATFMASWSYLIYFGQGFRFLGLIGVNVFVGPEVKLSFPVSVKTIALAVDGDFREVVSHKPVVSKDKVYVNETRGPNFTWTVPADPAPPTVAAPSSVGVELQAVPSVVLTLRFRAEADFCGWISFSYIAKFETDITSVINSIAGGTVPASIKTRFSAPVGNTAAANTTITTTVT
jgi:hypothetical protein